MATFLGIAVVVLIIAGLLVLDRYAEGRKGFALRQPVERKVAKTPADQP